MPIITVSRMYGAYGSDVAARVADSLGWTLYDNDIVERVAIRIRKTPSQVAAIEERVPPLTRRLADAMTLGSPEVRAPFPAEGTPLTEERLIEVTRGVIEEAVARGPVVLVGRGAQAFLAERPDAVHAFCYARQPALVANVAEQLSIPRADSERVVDDMNRQREHYVRRYWNRSWLAYDNYDVCVNTAALGVELAAHLIVEVARRRF